MFNSEKGENRELTAKAFDRVVNFSDGVIAIAMTLLFFPLTNLVNNDLSDNWWHILSANSSRFLATFISFIVIALFWHAHHRSFDRLDRADGAVVFLNLVFLFTVVVMPLTTVILTIPGEMSDRSVLLLYMGNLLISRLALGLIDEHARRWPHLLAESARNHLPSHIEIWTASFVIVVSLAIALVWPTLGTTSLILLCFNGAWIHVAQRILHHRRQRAPAR